MTPVDLAKQFAWLLRSDVRGQKSSLEPADEAFAQWWLIKGRSEYPYWSDLSLEQKKAFIEPVGKISVGKLELTVPKVMQAVIARRPDVIQKFSVDKKADPNALAAWFWMMGVGEHYLLPAIDLETIRQLDRPVLVDPTLDPRPVMEVPSPSVLMSLAWRLLGPEMQAQMAIEKSESRYRYLCWFFAVALPLFKSHGLVANRWKSWLLQQLPISSANPGLGELPRFALMEHFLIDVKKRPDLSATQGATQMRDWATKVIAKGNKWYWLKHKITYDESGLPVEASLDLPITYVRHHAKVKESASRPFGVNLYGFAYGELGVGEDVRMAAKACEAAGVPYRIVNIEPGSEVRQTDLAVQDKVKQSAQAAPYAINVFCIPGFDTAARVFLKLGDHVFENHYNIGWWPWELGVWPKAWDSVFGLMNEVWAGSQFSHAMYESALARYQNKTGIAKPCTPMPLAVSVDQIAKTSKKYTKKYFKLPVRPYLFLYVFDFSSHLERKNPMALIDAFSKAFGPQSAHKNAQVGLVLKVMNTKPDDVLWLAFEKHCAQNKRIHLINQTMDRAEVLGLISACDAYVSPHRAEGFGRTLAEAMLMGKPVVATNYSGNQFFMHPDVTLPVDYELVGVRRNQYHFIENEDEAVWANPSISHLAKQMHKAIEKSKDPKWVALLKAYAQQTFAPERTGGILKARLLEIANELKSRQSNAAPGQNLTEHVMTKEIENDLQSTNFSEVVK